MLHDRLSHAQLVNPVMQSLQVLLERKFLDAFLRHHAHAGCEVKVFVAARNFVGQVRKILGQQVARLGRFGFRFKFDHDYLALALNTVVVDFFLAQRHAEIADSAFRRLIQRCFHVHLQQEVHAAAQVQAQIHRLGAYALQPVWRLWHQVECHGVVFTQIANQFVLGQQLRIRVGKTHFHAAGIHKQTIKRNVGQFQCVFHFSQQAIVYFQ